MGSITQVVIVCEPPGKLICGRSWPSRTVVQVKDFDGDRPSPDDDAVAKYVITEDELAHIKARVGRSFFEIESLDEQEEKHATRARQTESLDATIGKARHELAELYRDIDSAKKEKDAAAALLAQQARELTSVKKRLKTAKQQLSDLDKKRAE
jgi:septal ring factor EnvC (AmiA/AmiB activator)